MVAGKAVNREQLAAFIAASEGVVAFNAAFDRPFVDALLPDLPPMPWGCAMADVAARDVTGVIDIKRHCRRRRRIAVTSADGFAAHLT